MSVDREMSKRTDNHYMEELAEVVTRRVIRKYRWLIGPSRKHGIKMVLLQEIMDFVEEIPKLKKEGESLNIGLTIKNNHTKLEEPFINRDPFHISSFHTFADFKNAIDGSTLCYIVNEKGLVSIGQIPKELLKENPRKTLQNISGVYQTITFHVGNSISEIYESGKKIKIIRKGIWLQPCSMILTNFNKEGFSANLLELVFQMCEEMSETNKSGIFVIKKDDSPKFVSPMIKDYHFKKCMIDQISINQIIELASIDGAVILNIKGEILNVGQKLEAPPSSGVFRESGRGTKHNSALNYSKSVDCVVFVVSHDGPISLYFKGELYARCFEELFGIQ